MIDNPAIADWFFYHRVQKFVETFNVKVLGATNYWMRFECKHHVSPQVHDLAWLLNASDVEKLLSPANCFDAAKEDITWYTDSIESTRNPAILPDGSNMNNVPASKTDPHVCNQVYSDVKTLTKTWLTWLLHASITPNVQLPTVHVMDDRSVTLVTPNHCSLQQCSWSEMTVNQHY